MGHGSIFKDQSGFALVMVMVTVLILEIICFFLTRDRGIQTMMAFNRTQKLKALYLAEAGLAHGLWQIQEDPNWRTSMNDLALGEGSYSLSFTEGAGQLSLNSQAKIRRIKAHAAKTIYWLTIQPQSSGDFRGEDTYISEDKQDDKYEINEPKELWLDSETNKRLRTLVRFDLTKYPLPAEAKIIAARFSMYLFKTSKEGFVPDIFRVHRVTHPWLDIETTWKNRSAEWAWDSPGGDFDADYEDGITFTALGWQTWRTTNLTRYWLKYPAQNYGLILETDARDKNNEFKFRSSANDFDPVLSPKLTVYYLDSRRT